ncbi:MAG: cell surface protein [Burkholderiaceae bacterium]
MKFAKLAIASAVLAIFSAPVLADPPLNSAELTNTTKISNVIAVKGDVEVDGKITVASEVGAVTDNSQASVGNLTITLGGGNTATIRSSGNDLTGNIGANMASGTGNAQGNEAALASLEDANSVFASAQTFSTQVSAVNGNLAIASTNNASLSNSFNNVSGNVGVNIASGSGNMQDNQLAAATQAATGNNAGRMTQPTPPNNGDKNGGNVVKATGSNQQLVALTLNGALDCDLTNVASITNALNGAMGNIGANMASGYGNLQHNSLSIASAK